MNSTFQWLSIKLFDWIMIISSSIVLDHSLLNGFICFFLAYHMYMLPWNNFRRSMPLHSETFYTAFQDIPAEQ